MKPTTLSFFCCPVCRANALEFSTGSAPDECLDGSVLCAACMRSYLVCDGILDLNPAPTEEARAEISAHHIIEQRWLNEEVPAHLHHLVTGEGGSRLALELPRCGHPELAESAPSIKRLANVAEDYFELLDMLDLDGSEVVVEIGAHTGWSARHLSERCRLVIATDISHQLGLSQVYLDHGFSFERVFCDMMTLPCREESVDMVFGVATIHHAGDLVPLFENVMKILKPGGRAVFFAEPVAGEWDEAIRNSFGAAEKSFGVQEHIYSIREYFRAARRAGLIPNVIPLTGLLRDKRRRWGMLRKVGLFLLRARIGYTSVFTRFIYPLMLMFYPRIPFPHFALALEKKT